jgi:hypothetical protein
MNTKRGPSLSRPLTHALSLFILPLLCLWVAGDREARLLPKMERAHRDE